MLTVTLTDKQTGLIGRGECVPYLRFGESIESVSATLENMRGALADGLDRKELQSALRPGSARNALDCALWDLEARKAGTSVWALAGVPKPEFVQTAYTLSVDDPKVMGSAARGRGLFPCLKIKLAGDGQDMERVRMVHQEAPKAQLIVDANEALTLDELRKVAPSFKEWGVTLIEQPLPMGKDGVLKDYDCPIPLCADESVHGVETLTSVLENYDAINIKLDKTGGLTEALKLREEVLAANKRLMIGCILCTSLGTAQAMVLTGGADWVDLDGPILLAEDREPALMMDGTKIYPPAADLWGGV